jgi:hypothetical protein
VKSYVRNTINLSWDKILLTSVIRVTKCRRIRQAGNVAWMVGTDTYAAFWFENLKDRDYLEYIGINASIMFKWALTLRLPD